jgi:hypothetical protein
MELRTEIELPVPVERAWSVLTDFEAYGEWNPFIPEARGRLAAGERLEVELCPPGGRPLRIRPRIVKVDPPYELSWQASYFVKGLFEGLHFFRLTAIQPERTRLVNGEDLSGMMVKVSSGAITRLARGFVGMNQALLRRLAGP